MKNLLPTLKDQKGALHLLLLVSILGVLSLSLIFSNAPLKDKIFSTIFRQNTIFASSQPDLDVTYISQTPKYNRYCVSYNNDIPSLCPGTENQKRFPDVGEIVTYTAHIKNKGSAVVGSFDYQWFIDGEAATSSAFIGSLDPGQEMTTTLQTQWTEQAKNIKFEITPPQANDVFTQNNSLSFGTRDLTISYWVETGAYNLFNGAQNMVGTFSFEDWVQAHIAKINERFAQAKYTGVSPDGIKDRIRIDKFVIADQLDIGGCPSNEMSQDPDQYLIDGRWQTTDGTCNNSGNYQNYVNQFINQIDWGLNHEVTHQLGIVDLYRMNVKNNEQASPNGGVQVLNINSQVIPYTDLNFPVFKNAGLMGGGETSPYNDGTYYESHTAGGLNSNFQKRRGFFGEYLFDTPDNNSIKILDSTNNPITGATVALYQKNVSTEDIDNTPELSGTTDAQGVLALSNRPVTAVTTVTGHTLKANPFGQINPVGTNGLMLLKITKGNQEGYGFYRLHDLNVEYMSGNTVNSTVTINTNYPKVSLGSPSPSPSPVPPGTNIALNKPVTASSNVVANGWNKDNAVDGAITSTASSMGWTSDSNLGVNHTEWIQISLGGNYTIDQVKLYPRTDIPGRFFPIDFQIQVSTDGTNFTSVVDKQSYPNPSSTVQSFSFTPVSAGFVRVNSSNLMFEENSYRVQFAEIEVYNTVVASPTPTPTPTPSSTSKLVFATSTTYGGNLGGVGGADIKCQTHATAAGLSGSYKAWISSKTESASSRLTHSTLPYKLVNGTSIANNWSDFADGSHIAKINITELGATITGQVWTNSTSSGGIYSTSLGAHCNNWTENTSTRKGRVGSTAYTTGRWTSDSNVNCNNTKRLYCIEQ